MTDAGREQFQAKLAALVAAYDELSEDARAAGSDEEAIKRATRLLDAVQGRTNLTSRWRASLILRLWRAEKLTYGQLSQRLGWSKERSVQIIRMAEKHEAEEAAPGTS